MRIAILTVSDSAAEGRARDLSGPKLSELAAEGGYEVVEQSIVPDERLQIALWLRRVCDEGIADLALTSGGTGLAPRDVTPEATRDVIEREAPGIAEAIRLAGLEKTRRAMLSRNVAGIRAGTLVVNLSGSPKAVAEQWEAIAGVLEHAVATIAGAGLHPDQDQARKG